jgi:hypothetical protein
MADFETVLRRLDEGFDVALIAQPIEVHGATGSLETVRAAARKKNHDVAFIGHRRSDQQSGSVDKIVDVAKGELRDVQPNDLVSASMPISSLIACLVKKSFALVLTGDQVTTIVTRADLNLLPVRVMLFTVMAHAEMLLAEGIARAYPADAWMEKLSPAQQKKIADLQQEKIKYDTDTRLLDCASLGQKCAVAAKTSELWKGLGCRSKAEFEAEREVFQRLRNRLHHQQGLIPPPPDQEEPEDALRDALAHGSPFFVAEPGVKALADVVIILKRWINALTVA